MHKMLLIGVDKNELKNKVKSLIELLKKNSLKFEILLQAGEFGYDEIESQIERSKIYIQIVGPCLDCSTWMNVCLWHAWRLNSEGGEIKPKLYCLKIQNYAFPRCDENIKGDIKNIIDFEVFLSEIKGKR